MKKVLFIIESLDGGGAEKVLISILNRMDYSKYRIDLLLFYKEGIYIKDVNTAVNIKSLFLGNKSDEFINMNKAFKIFYKLYRKLFLGILLKFPKLIYDYKLKENYDVEIGFLEGYPSYIVSKSPNKQSKKISWIHTDLTKRRIMKQKKEHAMFGRINKIVCVSKDSMNSTISLYPDVKNKIDVIYNPIDKEDIEIKSLEKIDYNSDKFTMLSIGRLIYEKGFDILIKAHKKLIEEGINNELLILGEGEKNQELNALINDLGVSNTVKLLGFKKNPYPYIKQCDLFVVPSRFEGFSLVLAEALVLGKPIVSTACAGPCELLENGKFGVLVNVEDVEELKENLKLIILNKDRRHSYAQKAMERKHFFDIDIVMKNIVEIIEN